MTNAAAVELGRLGGRVGGKSRSAAKVAAARINGHLGGRPRKPKSIEQCDIEKDSILKQAFAKARR